jgi:hypothetical protein
MSLGRIRAWPHAWPSLALAYPTLWPSGVHGSGASARDGAAAPAARRRGERLLRERA